MGMLERINEKMGFDVSNRLEREKAAQEYYGEQSDFACDDSKPSMWSKLSQEESLWVMENLIL